MVVLTLSIAINAIAMTAIAVTIKKHAPTVPTIPKTAIIGWQSSYISMPNCRQMTLTSTSSQPLSAHTVHQCCGNYRSEVIDYNYDYFSLKMPNCNFNYYLHLKVTITTKKG